MAESAPHDTTDDPLALLARARDEARAGDAAAAHGTLNVLLQRRPEAGALLLEAAVRLREEPERDAGGVSNLLERPETVARAWVPRPEREAGARWTDAFLALHPTERTMRRAHRCGADLEAAGGAIFERLAALPAGVFPREGPRLWIAFVERCLDAGRLEAAADLAAFGARRFHANVPAAVQAARAAAMVDRWAECATFAEAALAVQPENRVARNYLALAALAEGRLEDARRVFDETGLHHAVDFLALLTLVLDRHDPQSGEWSRPDRERVAAEGPGALARPMLPEEPARALDSVEGMLIAERFEEALAELEGEPLVVPCPDEPDEAQAMWLFLRGFALFHLRRYAEAASSFAHALAQEPTFQPCLSGLAQSARVLGLPAEAATALLEIQPVGPDDWSAHFFLGLCLETLGDRAGALRVLRDGFRDYFYDNLDVNLRPMLARVVGESDSPKAEQASLSK